MPPKLYEMSATILHLGDKIEIKRNDYLYCRFDSIKREKHKMLSFCFYGNLFKIALDCSTLRLIGFFGSLK